MKAVAKLFTQLNSLSLEEQNMFIAEIFYPEPEEENSKEQLDSITQELALSTNTLDKNAFSELCRRNSGPLAYHK